jgi:hypothetical protein
MRRSIYFIAFSAGMLTLNSCNNHHTDAELDQAAIEAYNAQNSSDVDRKWSFSSERDKMTDDTIFYAEVSAKKKLQFASPYNGGVNAKLTIRKDSETDIYLSIEKGIFIMSSNGGNKIKCRFDKDAPRDFGVSPSSDHSTDILFISDPATFISKIKKHKTLIIEAEFYQEGFKQMEFDITGFKWSH